MSKTVITFDTEHEGMKNDCQFDYYGLRIASCDSNGFVQVYSIEKDEINKSSKANFSAHAGPAWQVAWAHPKYESIIATCGYDKKINIWKEVKLQLWDLVYQIEAGASVNAISWAPWEYGLVLAAGSADGKIHIIQRKGDDNWSVVNFGAHDGGVNSISWGPSTDPSMLSQQHSSALVEQQQFSLPPKRFVSGGIDGKVVLWTFKNGDYVSSPIGEHKDWVRDVAWCNNIGLVSDTVASCSEDNKAIIWRRDLGKEDWAMKQELNLGVPAWKVSWSPIGNMLAVSGGDNVVQVFKEGPSGEFEKVSEVNEEGVLEDQQS